MSGGFVGLNQRKRDNRSRFPLDGPGLDGKGKHLASLASTKESDGLGVAFRVPGQNQGTADGPSDVKFDGGNHFDFEEWCKKGKILCAAKDFVERDAGLTARCFELALADL